jgi:hypothetical protein
MRYFVQHNGPCLEETVLPSPTLLFVNDVDALVALNLEATLALLSVLGLGKLCRNIGNSTARHIMQTSKLRISMKDAGSLPARKRIGAPKPGPNMARFVINK